MKKNENDFDVNSANDLNKLLTGVLTDVMKGNIQLEKAKIITLVADKINKNNMNTLEYKRMTKHKNDLDFFEDDIKNK